ncbi:MAG: tRNA lysidine(34) synthetase TilS [Verrucomicrobiota bacterium]
MLDLSLISPRKKYLLALSGGRDSVSLLHLLLEHNFAKLHLLHLNHQLRGKESSADANFVRRLAKKHHLPLTLEKAPVASLASQQKLSLETAARHARHQLFAHTAKSTRCNRILLAHHADDQAETILFNLLRGSADLKGISPSSELTINRRKILLLRPLLKTRRSDLNHYLSRNKIKFRDDSSNNNPAHTRNRLRHQALPLLTEIMGRDPVPALTRAETASREKSAALSHLLTSHNLLDPQTRLHLPRLRELPSALHLSALEQFLELHHVPNLSRKHLESALTLLNPDSPRQINLPGNLFLRRKAGRLFLEKK